MRAYELNGFAWLEKVNILEFRIKERLKQLCLGEDVLKPVAKTPKEREIDAANRTIDQAKRRKKQAQLTDLLARARQLRKDAYGSPLLPPPLGNPLPPMRQRKE